MGGDAGYRVVGNDFGHVSIWPTDRQPAPGWRDLGFVGTREQCLDNIAKTQAEFDSSMVRKTG
jgi:MbtH protein